MQTHENSNSNENVPMVELPRYKSHKVVHALKIHAIDLDLESGRAVITPGDAGYGPFPVDAAYMAKHKPRIGGYYVVYEDGYLSWSPADAFEKGYTKIDQSYKRASVNSALEFVCKAISQAETVGEVERHGSRAAALEAVAGDIVSRCQEALKSCDAIHWQYLARSLATVWWEVSKLGGTLQHGDLDNAGTMFSVVLEQHGGQCFHGETPMDAWRKARAWLVSPERPSISWTAQCDTVLTKLQSVIDSRSKRSYAEMKAVADRLTEMRSLRLASRRSVHHFRW